MNKVILYDKTIDECEQIFKLYSKLGYIILTMLPTLCKRHYFEDGYWDICLIKKQN